MPHSSVADAGARPFRIGELAAALGLNPKTIRYYEQIGLLPEPQRTSSGYRRYGQDDLERLRFIGKAKAIGLTLEEIKQVLTIRRDGKAPCEHVRALLEQKLAAIDRQLRALADVRRELITLRDEASRTAAADACVCGIIEQHQPSARTEPVRGPIAPV
jgi:DNA-binding transcriptional MerR regulator